MSHFSKRTLNPKTGEYEKADWIDGYFGGREYGIIFDDGSVYTEAQIAEARKKFILKGLKNENARD